MVDAGTYLLWIVNKNWLTIVDPAARWRNFTWSRIIIR